MADKLIIFDTTLRDGEQSPGASMTRDEKLRIAKLLERHTAVTVDGLRQLTPEKQRVICRLAGEDEYSHDEPMFERVAKRLHGIGDETANQCLQIAEQAANDVPWRQKPK